MPTWERANPFLMLLGLLSLLTAATLALPAPGPDEPAQTACRIDVRVRIGREASVMLQIPAHAVLGEYANGKTTRELRRFSADRDVRLTTHEQTLVMNGEKLGVRSVIFAPPEGLPLRLGAHRYFDRIVCTALKDRTVLCVFVTSLENYVAGVVHYEMGPWFDLAALEAQAIAARTYAAHAVRTSASREYDVRAGQKGQAYFGDVDFDGKIYLAVANTDGVVMLSEGRLFPAFYSNTCGGHTEGFHQVFGGKNIRALTGGKCEFCHGSRHYEWPEVRLTFGEIEKALRENCPAAGRSFRLKNMTFHREGGQGIHYHRVDLETPDGRRIPLLANDFRLAIGSMKIRSTAFEGKSSELNRERFYTFANGRGWGHAVGLCQYGAHGMARGIDNGKPRSGREILEYYYRDVEFVKLY